MWFSLDLIMFTTRNWNEMYCLSQIKLHWAHTSSMYFEPLSITAKSIRPLKLIYEIYTKMYTRYLYQTFQHRLFDNYKHIHKVVPYSWNNPCSKIRLMYTHKKSRANIITCQNNIHVRGVRRKTLVDIWHPYQLIKTIWIASFELHPFYIL